MSLRWTILLLLFSSTVVAQFAPPAGQFGTTAIHKDSSVFVQWGTHCTVQRGFIDITNQGLGPTIAGDSTEAIDKAGVNGVVSLGDGGSAIITFAQAIYNGPGWDFAVFENAFQETYLELAFVEVSSDGINYHRFPASSHTQDSVQIDGFGSIDATKINNLAGKYIANYGTPFDLEELANIPGLDINNITHVKIIDVVGCLLDSVARYDKDGNKINDPWRTNFPSGGFDLDAVGVIHATTANHLNENKLAATLSIYPNPTTTNFIYITSQRTAPIPAQLTIFNLNGQLLYTQAAYLSSPIRIDISQWQKGLYIIEIKSQGTSVYKKWLRQ
jgi:hypothetical protein